MIYFFSPDDDDDGDDNDDDDDLYLQKKLLKEESTAFPTGNITRVSIGFSCKFPKLNKQDLNLHRTVIRTFLNESLSIKLQQSTGKVMQPFSPT